MSLTGTSIVCTQLGKESLNFTICQQKLSKLQHKEQKDWEWCWEIKQNIQELWDKYSWYNIYKVAI